MQLLPINYTPGLFTQQNPQLAQLQLESLVANEIASKAQMNLIRLEMNNIVARENFQGPITQELMGYVMSVMTTLLNAGVQFNAADKVSGCVMLYCARLMSRMGQLINQESPATIQQFNQAAQQLGPELDTLAQGQLPQRQHHAPAITTGAVMAQAGGVHSPAMGQATHTTPSQQLQGQGRSVTINARQGQTSVESKPTSPAVPPKNRWGGNNTTPQTVEEHNPMLNVAKKNSWGTNKETEQKGTHQAGFRFTTEPQPEPVITQNAEPVTPELNIGHVFESQTAYVNSALGGTIPPGTLLIEGCYYFPTKAFKLKYETFIGYVPFVAVEHNKPLIVYIAGDSLMDYDDHCLKPQTLGLSIADVQAEEIIQATAEKPLTIHCKSINQKNNPFRSGSFEWKNLPQRLALWYGSKKDEPYILSYKARLEDKLCVDASVDGDVTMVDVINSIDFKRGPAVFFNNPDIDQFVKQFAARRLEPFISNYIYKALGETKDQADSLNYESALGDWASLIEILSEDYGAFVQDDFTKILMAACRFKTSKPGAVTEDMMYTIAGELPSDGIVAFDDYCYVLGVTSAVKVCTNLTADELGFFDGQTSGYISEHTHHYLFETLTRAFDDEFLQSLTISNVNGLTITVSRPATKMRMRWSLVEAESDRAVVLVPEHAEETGEEDAAE